MQPPTASLVAAGLLALAVTGGVSGQDFVSSSSFDDLSITSSAPNNLISTSSSPAEITSSAPDAFIVSSSSSVQSSSSAPDNFVPTSSSAGDSLLPSSSSSLPSSPTAPVSQEPCAIVSFLISQANNDPSNSNSFIEAGAVLNCLRSVPIDTTEASLLVDELLLYLQWQSNLNYLANPPANFSGHQIDMLADIKGIQENVKKGLYKNEYDFQWDLWLAFTLVYDFHLVYTPDILNLFSFHRGLPQQIQLVSISHDGQNVPQVYNYFDILAGGLSQASPIVQINGENTNNFLAYWSNFSTYNDPDARYNMMVFNQLGSTTNKPDDFTWGRVIDELYPDTTNFTYANHTNVTYQNYASPVPDTQIAFLKGIQDGKDLYSSLLNLPNGFPDDFKSARHQIMQGDLSAKAASESIPGRRVSGSTLSRLRSQISTDVLSERSGVIEGRLIGRDVQLPGYPSPEIVTKDAVVSGFYLQGTGYDDIAVLSLAAFAPTDPVTAKDFQDTVTKFLQAASAAGKKRLIIDLRDNGGGRVFLGYDLFKQLFPSITPWGATRFQANEAFNLMGPAVTTKLNGFTQQEALGDFYNHTYGGKLWQNWRSIFNYQLNLNENGEHFSSWADLFGPHVYQGENVTSPERIDLTDILAEDTDFTVTGYGERANVMPTQLFSAANIVLLQDGLCGSTCAIFSEMIKSQGGVQSVAVGGRPTTGPMQAVAGSKGAQDLKFSQIWLMALTSFSFVPQQQAALNQTMLGQLLGALRPLKRSTWSGSVTNSGINMRDNLRKGDGSQTPLQFVYEAADRRLFYTWDMIADPTVTWKATADVQWSNNKGAVPNSVGDSSSLAGGFKTVGDAPYGASSAASTARAPAGLLLSRLMAAVAIGLLLIIV